MRNLASAFLALLLIAVPAQSDVIWFGKTSQPKPAQTDPAPLKNSMAGDSRLPGKPHTPPAGVLAGIEQVASRHARSPVLSKLEISADEWAALFRAMIKVESGFQKDAVSPAGAIGLAQLMPETAKALHADPHDPIQNLDGGARYLLAQLKTFESMTLALAAYNAGPAAVKKHAGVPPYPETRNHIIKVFEEYERILRARN